MKTIGTRGTRSRKISTGCFLLCVDSKRKKRSKRRRRRRREEGNQWERGGRTVIRMGNRKEYRIEKA